MSIKEKLDYTLNAVGVEVMLCELCKGICNDADKRELHAMLCRMWAVADAAKADVRRACAEIDRLNALLADKNNS